VLCVLHVSRQLPCGTILPFVSDKFKCPNCASGRTKPLSIAISSGTRRRNTVGVSRRSVWSSTSTYKSDLVSTLPDRPSNGGAYLCMFLGVCGLLFALFVGSNVKGADGFIVLVVIVSALFFIGGYGAKKPAEQLANVQASWDNTWLCARCGHKWQQ
jgi:hypothetical protein